MKISRRQLKKLIAEGWGDKLFNMIDPTFHDEQESVRAIGRGDPIVSVEKAINALIPLSLDYRDASEALTSLRRLKKQLSSKPLQEMSSRFPPGREPGFKSTMKPFSLGSLPTDTISSSEADYYSDVDAASVDDYYTGGDDTSGIDIIYDGFEPQFDLTSWDFIINGQEVSTPLSESTDIGDLAWMLGELIAQVTGADYNNPDEEARIDKIAVDFLTQNQQIQQDLNQAGDWMLEYEG